MNTKPRRDALFVHPRGVPFKAVEAESELLEQIVSRFRPDSELSQLNRAGALEVSADLARVIAFAGDTGLAGGCST